MTRRTIRRTVVVALAWCVSSVARAQDVPPSAWGRAPDATGVLSSVAASWLGAWSPLRPIIDIPRGMLRAPLAPGLLTAPPPASGAFVLAGAPGSLARDLSRAADSTTRFSALHVRTGSERGDFHRPLDVADAGATQVAGFGWSPVNAHAVAIGRFAVDREVNDVSSFTGRVSPYSSSPIIMTDSVQPPMLRTRARLEGALGIQLGGFGVGLSAGIESRQHTSVDFPLRRSGHAATPAISVGAERVLPWFDVRIGVYQRWTEPNESNILRPRPLPTIIYLVRGYDEPFGLQVTGNDADVFTRNDSHATATGGTLEFSVLRTRVVLTHERGKRADDQTLAPFDAVRAIERWRSDGGETRMQLQRALPRGIRATVLASTEASSGSGTRSDLDGTAFIGSDKRRAIEADLRANVAGVWSGALIAGVVQTGHSLNDYVAELKSDVNTSTPFISAEVARRFGRAAFAVGFSRASHVPQNSVLPNAAARGPNFQRLISPALAYEVAESSAHAFWITATVPLRGSTLFATVRTENAGPRAVNDLRLQPCGDRGGWSLVVGIRP